MQVLSLNHSAGSAALRSLGEAQNAASLSISRLSSGNRLVRAGDDVAALSVSTTLQRNAVMLQGAIGNSLQARSLLEVTDGGLSQIESQLQRMKALAVQAGSGALTDSERGFLNQEFQNLLQDVERISRETNFNNVHLLRATQEVRGLEELLNIGQQATAAQATVNFIGIPTATQVIQLNGVSVVFGTQVTLGASITETVSNLANFLNASTDSRLTSARYEARDTALIITSRSAGEMANFFTINEQNSTANASFDVAADRLSEDQRYILSGGQDGSVSRGSVSVGGEAYNDLLTDQNITPSRVILRQSAGTNMTDGQYLDIDMGDFSPTLATSLRRFTFRQTATLSTDIQIGETYEDTMRNAVTTLNGYLDSNPPYYTTYGFRAMNIRRDGEELIFESNLPGTLFDIRGNNYDLTELSNANFTTSNFNNGSGSTVGGVNASGISNNEAFIGSVQGWQASFISSDSVQLSLTVGGHTYQGTAATSASGARVIEMVSLDGGFFQMQLADGGISVENQEDADTYAAQLDMAFLGLRFYQQREVTINPVGRLVEASVMIEADDFSEVDFSSVSVTAWNVNSETADIRFTLNGEEYVSTQRIGKALGGREVLIFESTSDSRRRVHFTAGPEGFDLSTDSGAALLQAQLEAALPRHEVNRASFIVGSNSGDQLTIALRPVSLDGLFGDVLPDILTAESAALAADAMDAAIRAVTSRRAEVGAMQARFDYARGNLETAFRSQSAARAVLTDTDIAAESTRFASEQVRVNASIGVMAQANRLSSYMLDLLTDGAIAV